MPDGRLNLDLTTKILRIVGVLVTKTINDTVEADRNQYCAITGNTRLFYSGVSQVSTSGTIPTTPTPPFLFSPLRTGSFKLVTAQDNHVHWSHWAGVYSDVVNAERTYKYPIESWANELNVQYPDYMRIRDQNGVLLWSTATLGDALFRVGQVQLSALNVVATFTSPNNRRLYILLDETWVGGTYTEDEGGSYWSASGLQFRFRNNGRSVDVCYASYGDGDIVAWFNAGNVSVISIFEVYGDV
ncbi:MAG: hypothetical protein RR285_00015 [Acinetobacter sp.]